MWFVFIWFRREFNSHILENVIARVLGIINLFDFIYKVLRHEIFLVSWEFCFQKFEDASG